MAEIKVQQYREKLEEAMGAVEDLRGLLKQLDENHPTDPCGEADSFFDIRGPQGHNTAQMVKILATWQRILESLAQEMEKV